MTPTSPSGLLLEKNVFAADSEVEFIHKVD